MTWCVCVSITSGSVFAENIEQLMTKDTIVKLRAGKDAPRVLSIQGAESPAWVNKVPEKLIDVVEMEGRPVPVRWIMDPSGTKQDPQQIVFTYESQVPRLQLLWRWRARAEIGPVEHSIEIKNLSGHEIWLPLQDSFRYRFAVPPNAWLTHVYVEKGSDTPSPVGTHVVPMTSGYAWKGFSSTYWHKRDDDPREIVPWSAVQRQDAKQSGWYAGIEFSGRTRISVERDEDGVGGELGLNPDPGPFRTRLLPGETFTTPTVFLGTYEGGEDGAGNILRRWVKQVLGNPQTWSDPNYPVTANNSWGSGTAVDESLALRMIADSAELGLEMFHLDAGWFRGVGDWYPDAKKFPHGLSPIAEEAHKKGLKFGLWVDWAQAGLDTQPGALNARDPDVHDWLLNDLPPDWKPEEFKGQTIDIGYPPAKQWAVIQLERMVKDFNLDMLEHDGYLVAQGCVRKDHPHAPADEKTVSIYKDSGFYFVLGSNSTDVSYHATRAYYDLYSKLREDHPGLLFEICNDGGRMIDFGSAAHGDYFSITDTYDPLSNRRAFYDVSHVLPAAILESYVEKWPTPTIENFRYMLRSGMMGWLSIMQDSTQWTDEQHRVAKAEIELYKRELRPLIRNADLYHVSPRPDGVHWDAIEYFDPQSAKGVVYVFRGSGKDESSHRFELRGVRPERRYRVRFHDGTSPEREVPGRELLKDGVEVLLPNPLSSELVLFEEVHRQQ